MRTLFRQMRHISIPVFVFWVSLGFSQNGAFAGDQSLAALRGPAFTDPQEVLEMPATWVKKNITYEADSADADVVISLDQQLYPALLPLIQEYAGKNNLNIAITNGTCGISAGMLSRKSIDIGGFCCSPGLTDRLPGLRYHTIGIAALALIVHEANPLENLTMEQARKIFMGETSRWSEIEIRGGRMGANLPIQPVGRLHCKLRAAHWRLLLDNEDLFSPNLLEVGAIPDMISQVSASKRAIGYETLWMVHNFMDKGRVKVLHIDGADPAEQPLLLSGSYPLFRVYNLTTWEGDSVTNPLAQEIVDYVLKQAAFIEGKYQLIPSSRLREAGWKYYGNELVGEPD